MTKIVMVIPFENVMTQRGNRTTTFAEFLFEKKHKVYFVTTNFYHAEKRIFNKKIVNENITKTPYSLIVLNNIGYKKNISIRRIISHFSFSIKSFFTLLKIKNDIDVIIIPSRPPDLIFCVNIFAKIFNKKIIVDVSDIWPDSFPGNGVKKMIFTIYCNLFQYLSLPFIKNYVYMSYNFNKWIQKYRKSVNSIFIPLGYEEERWKNFDTIKEIKGNVKIIYIGNISQIINLYPLLEAIKRINKYELSIVGGGDKLNEVKKYCEKNNIPNVKFYGFIPRNKIQNIIIKHHLSVIPMIGYAGTLPNKLFDSIASYRPIISFGNNDISNFVEKFKIGWKVDYSTEKVIEYLKNISEKEIIIKSENIKNIRNDYSRKKMYHYYEKFINNL